MDLSWLETFVVAAREQNFRRAAERLHLTQPTVSVQIDKLEQALAVPLFHRVGRSVRLSAAGRRYLRYAETVLETAAAGARAVGRLAEGFDETLTVAVSPLVATTYLPRWLRGFHTVRPTCELAIEVLESQDIADCLAAGRADVGLSRMPSPFAHITSRLLYQDPVLAVGPADQHDLDGPALTLEQCVGRYPLLTHNHPVYWDDLLLALRHRYPSLRAMRVSQVQVSLRLIEEGVGLSMLPLSAVRRALSLGSAVEVAMDGMALPTAATYLLTDPLTLSPAASAFVNFVEAYMAVRAV
jgi:LysR family transcriptional repressor of citA